MAGLYKDRLLLLIAEALAVTLQTMAHQCICMPFPNEEPLFRRTLSLMENALEDKDNPLDLNKEQIQELEKYYLDIAEAISYGIIAKGDKKHASNR